MTGRRVLRAMTLRLTLTGALVLLPSSRVLASDEGGSQSNSSEGSGDSSNGSKDSSNTSDGTSDDSRGSSRDSDNSTKNSPKNTTDYTSKGSSDWTTNSRGAHIFSIALAVVIVGAAVVGIVATNRSHEQNQRQATAALVTFMRRQHALLTHDVALGDGPVLDAWAYDLGLTPAERERLRAALDGSPEQGHLLDALHGPIDTARARRFSAAFVELTGRALGAARTRALVLRAARATRS
jgi:hypothetical protein